MRKALYLRLAITNLRKNKSTYFPYILAAVCSVFTFYTLHALAHNEGINSLPGGATMPTILGFGVVVVGVFATVLLFYTNSFLVKRRKKELGLYSILGMEKKHMARVLLYETLIIAAASLAIGLAAGALVGKLLFLLLLNMLQITTPLTYSLAFPSMGTTACLFLFIFLLTLATNLLQIRLANPIALLQGGRQGEKEPKASWILVLLGVLSLGGGYAISLTVQSPMEAIAFFFVAVLLVILGTYCLFTAGSVAVLKLLKRKKSFYYKADNFVAVSGMLYRMKQNAVGLANICILSTMVLVTVSTTVALYVGQEDILQTRFPFDAAVTAATEEDAEALRIAAADGLDTHRLTAEHFYTFRANEFPVYQEGSRFLSDYPSDGSGDPNRIATVTLLPLEDYNRMEGTQETLEEGEVLFFTDFGRYPYSAFQTEAGEYRIRRQLDACFLSEKRENVTQAQYILVVRDVAALEKLAAPYVYEGQSPAPEYRICLDLQGEDADKIAFAEELTAAAQGIEGADVTSRQLYRSDWYSTFGGFLFIGILLGLLFLMAAILIMYYKQISEGLDDRERFVILQKVGMSRREVHKTIRKQILLVFFLPLTVAALHITMAMPVIIKLLAAFALTNTGLILLCAGVTLLLFALLYGVVYALTAKTYDRLIQAGS